MRYLADVVTLVLDKDRCNGCSMCIQVCPHGVLAMENGGARILDRDLCMECGACARNCPTQAITVNAGVGCAWAVINSMLGRKDSCCTLDDYRAGEVCCESGENNTSREKPRRTGCC